MGLIYVHRPTQSTVLPPVPILVFFSPMTELLFNHDVDHGSALENCVEWCDQSYDHAFESSKDQRDAH